MEGLEFDLTKITAREMQKFFEAARQNDNTTMAKTFAQTATKCPFGDPKKEDTYLNLPYFGKKGFKAVLSAFVDASKNDESTS